VVREGREAAAAVSSVVSTEEKRPIAFSGVTFDARIDRMDRLESGGHAIVDYKTGGGNLTPSAAGGAAERAAAPALRVSAKEEDLRGGVRQVPPGDHAASWVSRATRKRCRRWPKAKEGWQPLLRD